MRKTDCLFPQTLLFYGRYLFKISLIFLFLTAWSQSTLLGQGYTFNKATFCKGVQSNYPYGPVNETTSFEIGDTPHAWMEITNVYGSVSCKFEWYRPDGSYYGGYTTNAVQGNGSWVRFYSIQNFYNVRGNWTCKFYVSHNNGGYQLKAERTCSYGGCICTAQYDPVCGADGKTYSNACQANCAGVNWTQGECCICTEQYDPVCGSDGNTYSNSCKAQCAGVSWTQGECNTTSCDLLSRITFNPDLCSQCLSEIAVYRYNGQNYLVYDGNDSGCSDALTTVVRCDGSDFCKEGGIAGFNTCGNFFEVATKVEVVLTDDCNTGCLCPTVIIPVCGSDGNTYNNSCEAACAGVTWTDGACGSPSTCVCTNSHADYICDDFQSYDIWQKLGTQSSCWTTWTGAEGGQEDGIIQQNTNTRNKYLKVKGNNSSGGGHQDVVLKLGNKTSGKYSLKFKIWLFNGDLGYYNIMHRFTPGTSRNDKEWASNCYFDGHGSGRLIVKSKSHYFTYKMGEWIDVEHKIDLNNDVTELHIDGKYVHRWRFSSQASGTAWGTNKLAAIDFYPVNNTHEFYIDKVELKKISNFNTAESRSKEEATTATAVADDLHTAAVLKIAPNPFTSTLSIEIPTMMTDADLSIIDQYGRVVKNQTIAGKDAASTVRLEVADLAVGVYYVRLASKDQVLTEKVVKSK